jgi:hypothetical protein
MMHSATTMHVVRRVLSRCYVRFGTRRVCSCFVLHGVLLVRVPFSFSFIECAKHV